jgi:hypothetical protein
MANSKLLKEAIADAKAVRETAIANAKIALEEAFTPRLQSILSKKLQAEMEGEEEEIVDENDTSGIGVGTNGPSADASAAHTELGADTEKETADYGEEDENVDVVSESEDEEEVYEDEIPGVGFDDPTNADDADISEEEMEGEDELDLESIIRELEAGMESDEEEVHEEEGEEEFHAEDPNAAEIAELKARLAELEGEEEVEVPAAEPAFEEEEMGEDDEIDLEEILREMGYGDDEEVHEEEGAEDHTAELEAELEEAYKAIKTLKSTINEVNLLNAKLLYANRLFRAYNLNNEQKSKVVENLDRTTSVREVKLVYATLAESMNFTGTERKVKRNIVESVSSKPSKSTAPKKEIISESTDELANRFKQLAGIIK